MKKGATTLPRTFICPLTATLPPRNRVFPTFPWTAMIFATLAYDPMIFPRTSIFAIAGSDDAVNPVNREPLPIKKGATTLPRAFICPLAAMLPPARSTFPIFPETPRMDVMFAYVPMMFPRTSRFADVGSVDVTPVSWDPLPIKNGATTFPSAFICPLAAIFPPTRRTFPTFPETPRMDVIFAYTPMILPRTSSAPTAGKDAITFPITFPWM